jgi:hypothetical protein
MQKDDALILSASATITTDTNGTAVSYNPSNDLYGQVVVSVTACDFTTGDETYLLWLEVNDGTTWRKLAGIQIPGGVTGTYRMPFSGESARKMAVAAALTQVRPVVDVSGTTPSITFSSFLTKL